MLLSIFLQRTHVLQIKFATLNQRTPIKALSGCRLFHCAFLDGIPQRSGYAGLKILLHNFAISLFLFYLIINSLIFLAIK